MKRHVGTKLVSLLLVLAIMITSLPMDAYAQNSQENQELYLKSVKLATASKAEDAKKLLEDEGYIFLDANLNEGTGNKGVYLGYTTTTDPTEAIYDMQLMNMKGGFTLTSMEKALETQKTALAEMTRDLDLLVQEFISAYDKGSIPAQKAYKALNFFRMVEDESDSLPEKNGLGYHLLHGNMTMEDMTEMLLFCDPGIVDSVIKILTMGIQGVNGNWIKKLSEIGPYDSDYDYEEEFEIDKSELKRRAEQMLPVLQLYAQAYNAMDATGIVSGEFDDNFEIQNAEIKEDYRIEAEDTDVKNMDISRYKSYKLAFDELEKYSFGDKTLKDYFSGMEDTTSVSKLYPLAAVLSDGEYSALSYGNVLEVILGAGINEEDFSQYDEVYDKATSEVKSIYLYGGVDQALLQDEAVVAFSDEANRHMASTGEMEFYEKESDADDTWENGKNIAMTVGAIGMGVMAISKLAVFGTMLVTGTWNAAVLSASTGFLGVSMKACTAMSGGYAIIVVMAAALVVAAISFVISAYQEWKEGIIDWDDNPIPEYIYDVKEVGISQTSENGDAAATYTKTPVFVPYEVVRDIYGEPVDLNARADNASQWITLYVSYDRAGDDAKPIKATDLKVQKGNGQTPEGYVPLTEFGEEIAKNLNSYDKRDNVNGIYFFYKQDTEIEVESSKKYYISDVYLQAGESPEHCMQLLEAAGYTPINVNLSPGYFDDGSFFSNGSYVYSYIGYKLTTNKNSAVRDIRVAYDYNASPVSFGTATYAECGSSAGVTLYISKYTETGTPILAGGLVVTQDASELEAGYEPVNFFAGGPAVSLNKYQDGARNAFEADQAYYLYFLPETTFIEGEAYLGGITYFKGTSESYEYPIGGSNNLKNVIKDFLKKRTGEEFTIANAEDRMRVLNRYYAANLGYHYIAAGDELSRESFFYYQTYNPYRAIYDVKATEMDDSLQNITVDDLAYTAFNRWRVEHDEFMVGSGYWYKYKQGYELDGNLYVTGNSKGNTYNQKKGEMSKTQPIKISEFICVSKDAGEELIPSEELGFSPLTDFFNTSSKPMKLEDHYIYVANQEKEELPYVSNIYSMDTVALAEMYGGSEAGVELDMIGHPMVMAALSSQGATHFCSHVAKMRGWTTENYNSDSALFSINRFYFAYEKTSKKSQAFRDMFLYYDGLTSNNPPEALYKGSVKYELVCEMNYNFTGYEDAIAPRVYLYATTDSDAGGRIIDFAVSDSPFKEGYETVRTMEGRSLVAEIVDALKAEKKNHPLNKFSSQIWEEWLDFFNGGAAGADAMPNGLFYLHFKREGEVNQQYISELYISKENVNKELTMDKLFDMGAEGFVDKDLNAKTIGDTMYLGYSYTTDASEAITDIRLSHSKSHPKTKTDDGITYQLASSIDLNDGCGVWSDYIYMYYTKSQSEAAGTPIAAIQSSSKVKNEETDTGTISTAKRWNSSKASDLNDGAAGEYIYLLLTRPSECPSVEEEVPDYGKDKTYTRKEISGEAEGKYLAAVYVMDKNTIRQEKIASGVKASECKVKDISDEEVFERLKEMGATTIVETPICLDNGSLTNTTLWKDNENKVFIGYSRTDTLRNAIKDIAIMVNLLSDEEPEESAAINGKTYKLVAEAASKVTELPEAISLLGVEDAQDKVTPRMYLYTTTSGDTPIYDICVDETALKNGWNTVRSQNGRETFSEMHKLSKEALKQIEDNVLDDGWFYGTAAFTRNDMKNLVTRIRNIFNPNSNNLTPFFIHCKKFEGESIEESKPYIGKVYVAKGESKKEALANLIEFDPDGYINCDLNKDAGGDHVYLGYKRVDNASSKTKAITDLVIYEGKSHPKTRRIYLTETNSVKYDIVSDIDLNEDAGGKYLYLYSTTDTDAGTPIMGLRISVDKKVNKQQDCWKETTVRRADGQKYTNEYIDLNKGAGGDYLYLVAKSENHVGGSPVEENRVEATCTKDGSYEMVVYCTGCNMELSSKKYVIPATGNHIGGEPVVENLIEATETADGSYDLVTYCEECGEMISTETYVIPATGVEDESEVTEENKEEIEKADETDGAEESEPNILGSIFSDGSVIAILIFTGIGLLAAILVYIKSKKRNV